MSHQKNHPASPKCGADAAQGGTFCLKTGQAQIAVNTLKPPESLRRGARGVASLSQPRQLPGSVWGLGIFPSVLGMGAGAGPEPWQGSGCRGRGCATPWPFVKPRNLFRTQMAVGRGQCILWGTASDQHLRDGNRDHGWEKSSFQPGHRPLPGWVEMAGASVALGPGGSSAVS